jgi:hypothetical protein
MSPSRPNNPDEFILLAVKSGLRTETELQEVLKSFRERRQSQFKNLDDEMSGLCDYLVNNGTLTRWQCDMLLDGRYKGFFIEIPFRLLYPAQRDDGYIRFVAEEIQTKRRVVVRILPPFARSREEPQPMFEIDEMTVPDP